MKFVINNACEFNDVVEHHKALKNGLRAKYGFDFSNHFISFVSLAFLATSNEADFFTVCKDTYVEPSIIRELYKVLENGTQARGVFSIELTVTVDKNNPRSVLPMQGDFLAYWEAKRETGLSVSLSNEEAWDVFVTYCMTNAIEMIADGEKIKAIEFIRKMKTEHVSLRETKFVADYIQARIE